MQALESYQKMLQSNNAFSKTFEAVDRYQRMLQSDNVFSKTFEAVDRYQRMLQSDNAFSKTFEAVERYQRMLQSDNAFSKAFEAIERYQRMLQSDNAFSKAFETVERYQEMLQSGNVFSKAFETVELYQKMLQARTVFSVDSESLEPAIVPSISVNSSEGQKILELSKQIKEFKVILKDLIDTVRAITDTKKKQIGMFFLVWLVTNVFLPQLNSLVVNLYTPLVQAYFQKDKVTNYSEEKDCIRLIQDLKKVTTIRYVTADVLNVRTNPDTRSRIIVSLEKGTLVRVLRKRKNWINIEATVKESVTHGWVFTRYVKRFK